MKTTAFCALLAATATAAPVITERSGITDNELTDGSCKKITFIMARGSTEIGNMGETVGPATCSALKKHYGDDEVACQGIGGAYTAGLTENALPGGTSTAAISAAKSIFNEAHTKCPNTIITAGGYSQGAAVVTDSISKLSSDVQDQIAAVILYGDTRNKQDDGGIPNFPKEKVKVDCNKGDGVCGGALIVTASHLDYTPQVGAAAEWMEGLISSAGSDSSGSSSSSTTSAEPSTSSSASSLSTLLGGLRK